MIYGKRSSNTGNACTIIQLYGHEVSIAMDDRSRGGDTPLTRTSLMVTNDGEEVTYQFAGERNTDNGAINDPEGWELFAVLRRIAAKANPQRFYVFSKKISGVGVKPVCWQELGIITALSLKDAMEKVDLNTIGFHMDASVPFADFSDGNTLYHLEEMSAWDGTLDNTSVPEPAAK